MIINPFMDSYYLQVLPKCERCRSFDDLVVNDVKSGDMVCGRCGLVLVSRTINQTPESLQCQDSDELEGESMIRSSNIDSLGGLMTTFVGGTQEQIRTMEMALRMSTDPRELRAIKYAHIVRDMANIINTTQSIKDDAVDLFSKAIMKSVPETRIIQDAAIACISIACRQRGYPRTIDELARTFGIDSTTISRVQRAISKALDIQLLPIKPSSLISGIKNYVIITCEVAEFSRQLCDKLTSYFEAMKPQLIAVVAIIFASFACNNKLNLQSLIESTNLRLSPVENLYNQAREMISKIFPSELQKKCKPRDIPLQLNSESIDILQKGRPVDQIAIPSGLDANETIFNYGQTNSPTSDISSNSSEVSRKRPRPAIFSALQPPSELALNCIRRRTA